MFSIFYKKPILIKQTLRELIIRSANDSIKRQIEYNSKEIQNTQQIVSPFSPDNPKQPGGNMVPLVVVFLSVSSIFCYFYWLKK
jgi:hypothetical protein